MPRWADSTGMGLRSSMLCGVVAGAMGSAIGGSAMAQPGLFSSDPTEGLEAIDPGYADVSPLGESLRQPALELRLPLGFGQVYRAPSHMGEGLFVRFSGGLAAVFPSSDYSQDGFALVPPDTVYYIGGLPPAPTITTPSTIGLSRRVNPRPDLEPSRPDDVDQNVGADAGDLATDAGRPVSIFGDEVSRRARVSELISRAALSD